MPDLGSRGEGWVALQFLLVGALVVAATLGAAWPDAWHAPLMIVGAGSLLAGASLAFAGSRALGPSLTPLPRPREGARFRDGGAYRLVRHPIYGGVMLFALGVSLMTSPLASVPTALLGLVFEGKRVREEAWLLERYPEYEGYRSRVRRRFVPYVW